jgi:thioredoxin-dependent peroxiredoxin
MKPASLSLQNDVLFRHCLGFVSGLSQRSKIAVRATGTSLMRLTLVYIAISTKRGTMMRKGMWIAVIMGMIAAGGFGLKAAAAADSVQVGAAAPNFTLPSQEDKPVSLKDYKGKWVVLYFYPKDQTTGCTIEAHNFQRDMAKYDAANAVVLGVSLDTVEGHKAWCAKDTFSFKLLADPDHKVVDAYGVPVMTHGDMKFASRQTFLISPEGKVVKVWPKVDVQTHSEEVLAEIAANKK